MVWTCDEDGRKWSCKMSFILNLEEMETEEEADQSWGGAMS